MTISAYRARWATLLSVAAVALVLGSCNVKDSLLEPQNPGLIDETAVSSPAAALALKIGAIGRVKQLVNGSGGETMWEEGGHLADEFKNSDFQPTRGDVDQRTMTTSNTTLGYNNVTVIRGFLRQAIDKMQQYLPTGTADIGELYMLLAFTEMSMAETYCNGIPLGTNKEGVVDYSDPAFKPLTTTEVYALALIHVDSALAVLGSATDNASADVRRAAFIVKARTLINQKQFAAAAALVTTTAVPAGYQYMWATSTSLTTDDLGIWQLNNSVARITVSDSFDIVNGQKNIIANAIPFVSANDPRVPVIPGSAQAQPVPPEDGTTPLFVQRIWPNRDDPIPMVSAIDARLIEAEGKLNADDINGMMTILNQLRADRPKIGNFTPGAMTPLPAPANKEAAISLYFREKAFWTFGRGQRLGDLRRLIRQYGRTEDKVFPKGIYYKGGVYGTDVNFPVPDAELVNPQFTGCIDRNA